MPFLEFGRGISCLRDWGALQSTEELVELRPRTRHRVRCVLARTSRSHCGVRPPLPTSGFTARRSKISLSIRRRTSPQSEVTAVPESSASHRRSISAAQAASTSEPVSGSRLSMSFAASSARSASERRKASVNRRSVVFVTRQVYLRVVYSALHRTPTRSRLPRERYTSERAGPRR